MTKKVSDTYILFTYEDGLLERVISEKDAIESMEDNQYSGDVLLFKLVGKLELNATLNKDAK